MLTRSEVAALVDHTLLKPEATEEAAAAAYREGAELGVYAVCLSPSMLPLRAAIDAQEAAAADGRWVPRTCVVAGFPSGKHHSLIKAAESRMAIEEGAHEVDMVIDVGLALAGDLDRVFADVLTVREAIGADPVLKVIVESAALLEFGSADLLTEVCKVSVKGGASFVKTSTGFHPSGGASAEAVSIMRAAVGPTVGVKASGGIRTADAARAMIDAGANRLGLSGTRAVLDGFPE
ncbi:Deoxyribose-phosphate aldolase OS=Tsukamurella paurometabola (strain ATCC 8368 / DSM / CCUG 35730 / CIP 100753 / JCM 10117 / KCTC 9821 / NBRC 16120 / NCIMB 702349 / NCTC 13040) OX=521096 GN=deoC PE=3 SV=1 [Tsukamurella paurometabola]|uniref:Deoxyribose-phosphate aldolase n=1 Tax=Tsukamurella paurometabola (strain ATCC 8368 / DSM 20162 / CCUG 35730 / CIP 100753 / JCM 10117 / KCTC 9821 / NBRC 16120 / NCIMB 702349 / NCTC 13040) TaxID=521096 RepID=D5UXZ4_TSUPD|nr:deoxyribose-phosphate aldolase [Tsukamurella paurometabola DSM 20162]SUP38933.1 Deoxyribose-phosphate aldolase [Tsukamurella paurometabola]